MSRVRRLLWPVPILQAAAAAIVVTAAVLIHSWPLLGWPVADWVRVSTEFHESLVLAGPLLAGCAAWTAGTFTGRNSMVCPASSVRSGYPIVARQMVVLTAVALVGYAAGLAPVLVATTAQATTGGLDPLVVIGSIVALGVFVAIGYLAGAALPQSLGIVIAVVVSFAYVLAAGMFGRSLLPVVPVWLTGLAETGHQESTVLSLFRLFFFVIFVVCGAIAASSWIGGRSPASLRISARGLLVLTLPAALAVVAANRPVDPLVYDLEAEQACADVGGVDVCVHQAHSAILDELVHVVSRTTEAAGPAATQSVERVVDAALWPDGRTGELVLSFQFQHGDAWADDIAFALAGELSGATTCHLLYRGTTGNPDEPDETAVGQAVGQWILTTSGYAADSDITPAAHALFDRLAALPDEQVRKWISDRYAALQTCGVSPDEIL